MITTLLFSGVETVELSLEKDSVLTGYASNGCGFIISTDPDLLAADVFNSPAASGRLATVQLIAYGVQMTQLNIPMLAKQVYFIASFGPGSATLYFF